MYQRSYNKPVLINPSNYILQTYRPLTKKAESITLDPRDAPTLLNWLISIQSPDLQAYIESKITPDQSTITNFDFNIQEFETLYEHTTTWKLLRLTEHDFIESYFYKRKPLTQTCHFPLTNIVQLFELLFIKAIYFFSFSVVRTH